MIIDYIENEEQKKTSFKDGRLREWNYGVKFY